MDAHFAEYVAVVESMQTIYGERNDGLPSDFHTDPEQGAAGSSDPGFCGALFGAEIAGVIVALFVGGMCSLIGSLVFFIRDVNLSLQAPWLDFPAGQREQVLAGRSGSASPASGFLRPSSRV
jgi:hypothetical protein